MTSVIAHRGASRARRENTVEAFLAAGAMGADAVELDVRRTADGVLVVHHDAALADGTVIVEVDHAHLPSWVPTLAEAMEACAGMWVNVEVKSDQREPDFDDARTTAALTADAIVASDWTDRVVVSSFDLWSADTVRSRAARVRTAWLVLGVPDPAFTLGLLRDHGHALLHPHERSVTEALARACRSAGVGVNTWTVDDPARMLELASLGVDGIVTNVPDVAVRALRAT